MAKQLVQIEIYGTPIEIQTIKTALQKLADLPKEDCARVCEVIKNPKALAGLKKHWTMLKMMF